MLQRAVDRKVNGQARQVGFVGCGKFNGAVNSAAAISEIAKRLHRSSYSPCSQCLFTANESLLLVAVTADKLTPISVVSQESLGALNGAFVAGHQRSLTCADRIAETPLA
jgi:hypothetical protein